MSATKTTTDTAPWLTLAVLVHNPDRAYLDDLFESLLKQSEPFYLDIIDDSPVAQSDIKIPDALNARYIRHDNNAHGLSGNWNFAVREARSRWVSVLHQDDMLHPDYTQIIAQLIEAYPRASAVFSHAQIIDENGQPGSTLADQIKARLLKKIDGARYTLTGDEGSATLLRGNFIFCPAVCFNREMLGSCGFDERWKMVPDLALYLHLLFKGHTLAGSKKVGMLYRRHQAQATAKYQATGLRFEEEFALYRQMLPCYELEGWWRSEQASKRATILKLHVGKEMLNRLLRGQVWQALKLGRYFFRS